jgi:hypothetical protein
MVIDEREVAEVAKKLALVEGHSVSSAYRIGDGFEIPRWLTFISEARKLVINRIATQGK